MPNWCSNNIVITGNSDSLSKIKRVIEENTNRGLFDSLVGHLPSGMTEEDYQKNWYDINCERWGCKWDVEIDFYWDSEIDFEKDNGFIHLYIDTAWSPCNGFLRLLSEKYGVDVENNYSESGNDFAGVFTIADGNESDECYEYLEGLYHIDYDTFISEVEIQLEWMAEDGNTPGLEEWIASFEFIDDDYVKEELKKVYEEVV